MLIYLLTHEGLPATLHFSDWVHRQLKLLHFIVKNSDIVKSWKFDPPATPLLETRHNPTENLPNSAMISGTTYQTIYLLTTVLSSVNTTSPNRQAALYARSDRRSLYAWIIKFKCGEMQVPTREVGIKLRNREIFEKRGRG
jgi:hypothetical protein